MFRGTQVTGNVNRKLIFGSFKSLDLISFFFILAAFLVISKIFAPKFHHIFKVSCPKSSKLVKIYFCIKSGHFELPTVQ